MDASTMIKPLTSGMRLLLRIASVLVFLVGILLFILTEQTDQYFAWTINPPLTASALGAAYWASSLTEVLAARQETWAGARVAVPSVLLFTSLTTLATFIHLDKFHLGGEFALVTQLSTWVWIVVYITVPVAMSLLLILQLRTPGEDPPRQARLPGWFRVGLSIHAVVMLPLGVALFLIPAATLSLWPWMLSALTARAVGAWLLGTGVAAAHSAWENDWGRVSGLIGGYALLGIFELIAVLRYPGDMFWGHTSAWVYLAFLVSIVILGWYGSITIWRRTRSS